MNAPAPPGALVAALDELLPQTQCRQCGFDGCRPYAEALAAGAADIDRCPPGGDTGAARLAALLGVEARPVDRRYGVPQPPAVALIEESQCIGCTLCIQACPVDAIVGAAKLMHTVIAAECTGCELCLAPCPVDCIVMHPAAARPEPSRARARFEARSRRLERAREERAAHARAQRSQEAEQKKRDTIARAVERAQARLRNRES
jgi:Na+-translocating ferredoxin:NAD+ oxidoreductase subunit B